MVNLLKNLIEAKAVSKKFTLSTNSQRTKVLLKLAEELVKNTKQIISANKKDLEKFSGSLVMRERLELSEKKILVIAAGVKKVGLLSDPLNKVLETTKPGNGLLIKKVSVPLGMVGVIYESRPNVTVDLAALAIKSGNGLILKGGKESSHSNKCLVTLIQKCLKSQNLSDKLIFLVDPQSDWKKDILNAHGIIDVLIPRGGAGLIEFVRQNSRIPIIETGAGVCHIFVDEHYNLEKAAKLVVGSKIQRPSACNALDTLVVHKAVAKNLLQLCASELAAYKVKILADKESFSVLKNIYPKNLLATAKSSDYGKEFLDFILSVKVINSFKEGLEFVKKYSSGHSEAVLTNNNSNAEIFLNEIDAAVVYRNSSTRFTDGEEFGMGAEVGISTQKLHARGPMGLEALTSYKWLVVGDGKMRK